MYLWLFRVVALGLRLGLVWMVGRFSVIPYLKANSYLAVP